MGKLLLFFFFLDKMSENRKMSINNSANSIFLRIILPISTTGITLDAPFVILNYKLSTYLQFCYTTRYFE